MNYVYCSAQSKSISAFLHMHVQTLHRFFDFHRSLNVLKWPQPTRTWGKQSKHAYICLYIIHQNLLQHESCQIKSASRPVWKDSLVFLRFREGSAGFTTQPLASPGEAKSQTNIAITSKRRFCRQVKLLRVDVSHVTPSCSRGLNAEPALGGAGGALGGALVALGTAMALPTAPQLGTGAMALTAIAPHSKRNREGSATCCGNSKF